MHSDSQNDPGADPSNQPTSPAQPKPAPALGTPPDVNPGTGATSAEEHPLGASEPMPPDPEGEENGDDV
jgi:hypothetical protein